MQGERGRCKIRIDYHIAIRMLEKQAVVHV